MARPSIAFIVLSTLSRVGSNTHSRRRSNVKGKMIFPKSTCWKSPQRSSAFFQMKSASVVLFVAISDFLSIIPSRWQNATTKCYKPKGRFEEFGIDVATPFRRLTRPLRVSSSELLHEIGKSCMSARPYVQRRCHPRRGKKCYLWTERNTMCVNKAQLQVL